MEILKKEISRVKYRLITIATVIFIVAIAVVYFTRQSTINSSLYTSLKTEIHYMNELSELYTNNLDNNGEIRTPDEVFEEVKKAVLRKEISSDATGATGEIVMGMKTGDKVDYLLVDRTTGTYVASTDANSEEAKLMMMAINSNEAVNKVGIKDYEGRHVYAVFQNIEISDGYMIGVVVKIDVIEVIAPVLITFVVLLPAFSLLVIMLSKGLHSHLLRIHIKLVEERELAEEANYSKTEFLTRMSHELRTPMNSVVGYSELLLHEEFEKDPSEYLKIINTSSKNLLSLLNDVLDYSKIEISKLDIYEKAFCLQDMVKNTYKLMYVLAREKGVTLNLNMHLDSECKEKVLGDEPRLVQILVNLLGNAIKFTGGGKNVDLIVDAKINDGQKRIIKFTIQDEGIGMDANQIDKVFEPFRQANESIGEKYGGTGLGLSITKQLINIMNGNLHIESTPNVGTLIEVCIPFKTTKTVMLEEVDISTTLKGKKILVVDDFFANRLLVKEMLQLKDIEIFEAESGAEAIELLQSGQFEIDAILMDIQMPEMNGFQATQLIREFNNKIPIIALSADSLKEQIEDAIRSGMNDYITKPIDFRILINKLVQYCQ